NYLGANARALRPGHICRAGNNCRAACPSGRRWGPRVEHQRKAVHAIAQTGGPRSVVKHMTEMAAAAAAMHLGPRHSVGAVIGGPNGILKRLIEARPARPALELCLGREQRQVAAGAGENAFAMLLQ